MAYVLRYQGRNRRYNSFKRPNPSQKTYHHHIINKYEETIDHVVSSRQELAKKKYKTK